MVPRPLDFQPSHTKLQIGTAFYRVRELRLPVREHRPGSIGVHRTRKCSGEEQGAICLASRGPRCL